MPSAEAVELVLTTVPGVERAHVEADADTQGSLRIRVAEGYDARIVAEEVSNTLWDRFSIELPPESLLRQPAEPVSARSPVASLISGSSDTVVLYDAAQERSGAVMDADLPGWDDVLVGAQQAAERGEAMEADVAVEVVEQVDMASAETAPVVEEPDVVVAHDDEPEPLTPAEAAAIPEPALPPAAPPSPPAPPVAEPAPVTLEEPTVSAKPVAAADVRLQSVPVTESAPGEIRIVDATIEGEGLGRRAVVVVNRADASGDHRALGATLVDGNEAFAIAAATLQAVNNLA